MQLRPSTGEHHLLCSAPASATAVEVLGTYVCPSSPVPGSLGYIVHRDSGVVQCTRYLVLWSRYNGILQIRWLGNSWNFSLPVPKAGSPSQGGGTFRVWLTDAGLPAVSSHGGRRVGALMVSLVRTPIPTMGAHPRALITSQRLYLLTPSRGS